MAGNFDNQAGLGGHLGAGDRPKWARDALLRRLYARGDISQIALGKQFGLSQAMVSVIIAPPSPRRREAIDEDAENVVDYYHIHDGSARSFVNTLRTFSAMPLLPGFSHLKLNGSI